MRTSHKYIVYIPIHQVREELYVDTSRGEKLKINFDINFHRMPCLCECGVILGQIAITH